MRIDPRLSEELKTFQPDLVGIGAVTANLHLAKSVLKETKRFNPEITTVIGGHHATLVPGDCYDDYIDIIVIGEGEETFPELLDALERGKSLSSIPGIAYRKNDYFTHTGERDLIDINTLPFADRSLTERYRKEYFRGTWRPTASIISSRGCPFRCDFCAQWKIYKSTYRIRKPELVARELGEIREKYINFIDDNTLENYRSSLELCEVIKAEGIEKFYEVYSRADTIAAHPDLIEKWRDIGLKLVLIGLESIDEDKLLSWNKRISLKTNKKAIDILHGNDIEIAAYFVIDPDFGREDFESLLSYIEDNGLTHPIFTILSPFPGTELRKQRSRDLISDSYRILDFFHTVLPTRLPLEEFYRYFSNLYFQSYSTKKSLKNMFRSRAFLSPRLIFKTVKMRKKLKELYLHHSRIREYGSRFNEEAI